MIKYVDGNILDAKETLILQQVNCRGVMGAGLAKAIYSKWPQVKIAYVAFCVTRNPYDMLGQTLTVKVEDHKWVVNIFGQLNYGRQKVRYTDYNALIKAFKFIAAATKESIAIPYGFGCGLANGDWNVVSQMIETIFKDNDVTIYKLKEK